MKSPAPVALLLAALAAAPSLAAVDLSIGARVDLGDDAELFLDISSRHFDLDPVRVHEASRLFPRPDDLAVALFIADRTGRSPQVVFEFRKGGTPWTEVGRRCGVPVDAWFVAVERDPGPPYGRAYGHWRKVRKHPGTRFALTDAEARDLVAVRMAHEYYGVPVVTAMSWRRDSGDVRKVMNREYRRRHVAENEGRHDGGREQGRGKDGERGGGKGAKHGRRSLD